MAKPTMTRVTSILALLLLFAEATALVVGSKADVNIFNEVGETIAVLCRSGDDDLGEQQIAARGVWGWGFSPSWFGTTLFWCRFAWRNRIAAFDVWTDAGAVLKPVGFQPCVHCEWRVQPDGFYRTERGGASVKIHTWS